MVLTEFPKEQDSRHGSTDTSWIAQRHSRRQRFHSIRNEWSLESVRLPYRPVGISPNSNQSLDDTTADNGLETFLGQSPSGYTETNSMAQGQAQSQGEQQYGLMLAQQMASGQGPQAYQQTLLGQNYANTGNQNAMANSALGGYGTGIARHQASMANAQTQQQAAGQAQVAAAQQQMGAMGMEGAAANQARQQDLALSQNQATSIENEAQNNLGQYQVQQQVNQAHNKATMGYLGDIAHAASMGLWSDENLKGDAKIQKSGLSLARDADLQEPGGDAHWVLREEPNFILAHNARTGELQKIKTEPLSKAERKQALGPHGAGPIQKFSDADMGNQGQWVGGGQFVPTGGTGDYNLPNGYLTPTYTSPNAPALADQGITSSSNTSSNDVDSNQIGTPGNSSGLTDTLQAFTLTNAMQQAQANSAAAQQQAFNQQANAARGNGPSVANAQLRSASNAALADQNAKASSGSGSAGGALSRRNSMMGSQKDLSSLGGQAAAQRVQEQLGALQGMNQISGQSRAGDIGLSQDQAQAINQQAQENLQRYAAQQNAQIQNTALAYQGAQMAAGGASQALGAAGGGGSSSAGAGGGSTDASAANAAEGNEPVDASDGQGDVDDSDSYGDVNLSKFDPTHGKVGSKPSGLMLMFGANKFHDADMQNGSATSTSKSEPKSLSSALSGIGKNLIDEGAKGKGADTSGIMAAARPQGSTPFSGTETADRLSQHFSDVDHLITQNPYDVPQSDVLQMPVQDASGTLQMPVQDMSGGGLDMGAVANAGGPGRPVNAPLVTKVDFRKSKTTKGAPSGEQMSPMAQYNGLSAHDIWRMRNGLPPESATVTNNAPGRDVPKIGLEEALRPEVENLPYADEHAVEDKRIAELLRHKTAAPPTITRGPHRSQVYASNPPRNRLDDFAWSGGGGSNGWSSPAENARVSGESEAPSYGLSYGEQRTFKPRGPAKPLSQMTMDELYGAGGLSGASR